MWLPTFLLFSYSLIYIISKRQSYVVYLGGHSHGPEATLEDYERVTDSHHEFLGSFLGSKEKAQVEMFYSYTKHINGFAATLEEEEAKRISKHPEVISVFENTAKKLHTTRSWDLVAMERDGRVPHSSIWAQAKFGNDTIIATLDTGVWPESESFNDRGMGPVPSRWRGSCQNNTKEGVPCNRKLIGARYFTKGYEAGSGKKVVNGSARDTEGHGSHTLSTAAGRFVPGANIFGQANGTAKGGSPDARVAAYKVCWDGCYDADLIAAFDAAIHDGVDVLSVSVGGDPADYFDDPIAIGSFHAVVNGITVVCSAGNSGPARGSVSNIAPWIVTAAASTIDRDFPAFLTLGDKKQMKGGSLASVALPANKFYPLISGADAKKANVSAADAQLCFMDSLDPNKVKGKIVACLRGIIARMEKGAAVLRAGGAGMVLINDKQDGNSLLSDPYILPALMVTHRDGVALRKYMDSTKSPVASISAPATKLGVKPAPTMAAFSSQGPNLISPHILKPDITAPGVGILAAFTGARSATGLPMDNRHVPFNLLSGTSMSCPHVSGLAGLLKTLHPHWTPAAIRSAIMTTARSRDNTGSPMKGYNLLEKATPFAHGSGHIRPNRAMDPGLVFDLTLTDYLNYLCAFGYNSTQLAQFSKRYRCPATPIKMEDFNYPSIAVPTVTRTLTLTRTVKNVGSPGTYKARVEPPYGITMTVKPEILKFDKVGEEKAFEVTLKPHEKSIGRGYLFGRLIWSDGRHYVRIPVAVNALS
ncbi:subtilisin-like protease SBT5.3 [Phoenix dactylifera]|uniref:Subtilisin-like protease SBT5.3 n=1 Tax=Phoenix dactylifera TaxID=42345 RepID=A0A8B8ZG69_PHODC|nr:subtilisin-like protease SBT5.3 [Phoenix dactylifera]